jgi:hypothetical protein
MVTRRVKNRFQKQDDNQQKLPIMTGKNCRLEI